MTAGKYRPLWLIGVSLFAACAASEGLEPTGNGGAAGAIGSDAGSSPGPRIDGSVADTGGTGCIPCSDDGKSVLDCEGNVVAECQGGLRCAAGKCVSACEAAGVNQSSIGCDYYAVNMDGITSAYDGCFVAFVANTFEQPAKISASFAGKTIDIAQHGAIPQGSGQNLTYKPLGPGGTLPAGEVAILFLAHGPKALEENPTTGKQSAVPCPITPAIVSGEAQQHNTRRGNAFHITTDVPVVAYQMLPYGGGSAAVTGATLLLPTSAWHTNYIAANAYRRGDIYWYPPTMNIVAMEDDTSVTILPKGLIKGYGKSVPGAQPNQPVTYVLNAGEHVQLTEQDELTGSPIESDKPVGVWGGQTCMFIPSGLSYCDHAEQQLPPVRALGHQYVAASYRARTPDEKKRLWRIVGAVDGTQLEFNPSTVNASATLNRGDILEFWGTGDGFLVESQDKDHPFMVFGYMSGSSDVGYGVGDPEFVRMVPPAQYMKRYVFFTDPTYPETNLVVVRQKKEGQFEPVELDCLGTLSGWQPVGTAGDYEMTRVDLVKDDFQPQGACDNGRHEMSSPAPFGLWVWGWGSPLTTDGDCTGKNPGIHTCDVSYGYPAGENVRFINEVVVKPVPH